MRKYIKSMRQQYDNNSFIFKEAKKMFHYEPTNQGRAYGYPKQSKSRGKVNEFKDDFSSVKDNKMQSNEINESSWIAKLVNGIQQNSLEDLRVCSKEMERRRSDEVEKIEQDIRSAKNKQNIVIIDNKRQRRGQFDNITNKSVNTQAPTKKNSYNLSKKKSDTYTQKNGKTIHKNQTFEQNDAKEKSNTKSIRSISQSKSMSRNVSQSVIIKSQTNTKKEMGSKKKSLQNIYVYKGTQESKTKSPLHDDKIRISTLKTDEKMMPTEKNEIAKDGVSQELKFNESISEMQEIKCITDKKDKSVSEIELKQKNNCLLDDYFSQPLFQQPGEEVKKLEELKVEKKIGSIRKNKALTINNRSEKTSSNCSFRQQSTEAMVSPKFSSNNITLKEAIKQKPSQEEDYISARQQKQLIDKYLRTDYSFKCNTPLETQNISKQGAVKKNSDKKYSYEINDCKSFQNTNRFLQTFNARDLKRQNYRSIYEQEETIRENSLNFRDNKRNYNSGEPAVKEQNTIRNYVRQNKQNYSSLPITKVTYNSSGPFQPVRTNPKGQDRQIISKEAYLHESMESVVGELPSARNSLQNTGLKYKPQQKEDNFKKAHPSKYFYMIQNSVQQQEYNQPPNNIEHSCEKKPQIRSVQGSEKLIDRLNSKLNSYINQHNLIKEEQETEEWTTGEPTYRAMHLTFNELKKHRQFVRK